MITLVSSDEVLASGNETNGTANYTAPIIPANSLYYFSGYKVFSSTGMEDWFFDTVINNSIYEACFKLKTKDDYSYEECTFDEEKNKTECEKIKVKAPKAVKTSKDDIALFDNIGDKFCKILKPFTDMFYRFGNESIILVGDTSHNSNNTNVTQESGFAHLGLNDTDIVLYMPFDINQSTTVYDYSKFGNDGTIGNGTVGSEPLWNSSGYIGGAYTYDGTGDAIEISFDESMNIRDDDFSISVWIKTNDSYLTDGAIFNSYEAFVSDWLILDIDNGGNCLQGGLFFAVDDGTNPNTNVCSTTVVNDNVWHHVVVTRVASANNFSMYVDGVFEHSNTDTDSSIDLSKDFRMGYVHGLARDYNGSIDEIMMVNRTLSTSEISDIYNAQLLRFNSSGEMLFKNINLGTNDTVNVTFNDCQQLNGTNLTISFNGEAECDVLSSCNATACTLGTPANNANMTIKFDSNAQDFYTPLVIKNISLDGYVVAVGDTTIPYFANATNDTNIGRHQNITMNITMVDETALANYTFSWNNSGAFVNDTSFQIGAGFKVWDANVSKNITTNEGAMVSWRYFTCDTSNNCNTSATYNFTVINSLPTQNTPILNSTSGTNYSDENLTVYNQSTSDLDGDNITNIIDWKVDGTSIAVLNMPFDTNRSWESGSPIRDYSLNVNNGSLQGNPIWFANGTSGGAYEYDSYEDYINVSSATLNITKTITVEAWINSYSDLGSTGFISDSTKDTLEFDTSNGIGSDILPVSGDIYAVVYSNTTGRGLGMMKTVNISTNGSIANSVIDTFIVDYSWGAYPHIRNVDGNIYAVFYGGYGLRDGIVKTVNISTNGSIEDNAIDNMTFESLDVGLVDIVEVNSGIFAIVYNEAASSGDGFVKTVNISSNGSIADSVLGSYEFDTSTCSSPRILRVKDSIYAIAYSGVDSDGFVKTVNITSNGTIEQATKDFLEFDTDRGNVPDFVRVDNNVFAVAYRGPATDGFIKTFNISDNGSIGDAVIDTYEFVTADISNPDFIQVTNNTFSIAYKDADGDGIIKTVEIKTNGTIVKSVIDTLEFDTSDGGNPTQTHVKGNTYAVAYDGSGTDGFLKTLEIKRFSGVHKGLSYGIDSNKTRVFGIMNGQTISSSSSAGFNHVVITYDSSTRKQILYVNGAIGNTQTLNSISLTTQDPVLIGQNFDGAIDGVKIYNRTLTPNQVRILYNSGIPKYNLLSSNETYVGDIWSGCITPNDADGDGLTKCSNNLTILSGFREGELLNAFFLDSDRKIEREYNFVSLITRAWYFLRNIFKAVMGGIF